MLGGGRRGDGMKKDAARSLLTIALLLAGCGGDAELGNTQDPVCSTVRPGRELMIRHLSVVNDATRTRWTGGTGASDGAWHFGRLMANMVGDQNPSDFVRSWLSNFQSARTINGDA